MYQIASWPVVGFWNRMSGWPSPLKSAMAMGFQFLSWAGWIHSPRTAVLPFISQNASWPVVGLCSRSVGWSWSFKYVVATAFHPEGRSGEIYSPPAASLWLYFCMYHIASLPEVLFWKISSD